MDTSKTQFTSDDLKTAYHNNALNKHPDQGGSEKEWFALKDAYETLTNPLFKPYKEPKVFRHPIHFRTALRGGEFKFCLAKEATTPTFEAKEIDISDIPVTAMEYAVPVPPYSFGGVNHKLILEDGESIWISLAIDLSTWPSNSKPYYDSHKNEWFVKYSIGVPVELLVSGIDKLELPHFNGQAVLCNLKPKQRVIIQDRVIYQLIPIW